LHRRYCGTTTASKLKPAGYFQPCWLRYAPLLAAKRGSHGSRVAARTKQLFAPRCGMPGSGMARRSARCAIWRVATSTALESGERHNVKLKSHQHYRAARSEAG